MASTSAAWIRRWGREVEHEPDADEDRADPITDCDGGKFCVFSDLAQDCDRAFETVGEREIYLVVDLNGERAVIAVYQDPNRSLCRP